LDHCFLTEIPDTLKCLTQLKTLHLAKNPFISIPSWINNFSKLGDLNVSSTNLNNLELSLPLFDLDISATQIESLAGLSKVLPNVELLDLSSCPISSFTWISELKTIYGLYLDNLGLCRIPEEILIKPRNTLTALSLGDNRFTRFPSDLIKIKNLRDLNFKNNQLEELPQKESFASIKQIELGGNKFVMLPSLSSLFPNLNLLGLEYSNLTSLREIPITKTINALMLAHNKLTHIDLPEPNLNLHQLDLSFNQITSIPDINQKFPNLIYFNLFGNPIREMDQEKLKREHSWINPEEPDFWSPQ